MDKFFFDKFQQFEINYAHDLNLLQYFHKNTTTQQKEVKRKKKEKKNYEQQLK